MKILTLLLLLFTTETTTTTQAIEIKAKRFEFAPNVVHLKKGEPVTITPTEAGTFHAICDHYCGSGHGNMKMTFVVE
jgi:hypothetical protein